MLRAAAVQLTGDEREVAMKSIWRLVYEFVTFPFLVVSLFCNPRIDPAYGLGWPGRVRLAWRMYRNSHRMFGATSYKAHLAMAVKLLEVPPSVEGVVVECGSFLGASTTNLSLACEVVGRELIVYDSFEGLPAPRPGERFSLAEATGSARGSLATVQSNVSKGGAIDCCTFRKGWFADTLPNHTEPIVLCSLDVDYEASLHDCLVNLWPRLVDGGLVFTDEYVLTDYVAAFYSERYWDTYFDSPPPGLLGAGTGIPIGNYYLGPWMQVAPLQSPGTVAYTWKGASARWTYFPESGAPTD
jgi:hypothetical protein